MGGSQWTIPATTGFLAELERSLHLGRTATADELRDLANLLRALSRDIFQGGQNNPSVSAEAKRIRLPILKGWYKPAFGLRGHDYEQQRLFDKVGGLLSELEGGTAESPCERLKSLATDCDKLVATIAPQLAEPQHAKLSEKEIALARAACLANPKILRADLMTKLEIGSNKASVLIDLMRNEGIHKTRKRKAPNKNH